MKTIWQITLKKKRTLTEDEAVEVLDGKKYGSKADIWSIGNVFYEMLFGKPPFKKNYFF